MKDENNSQRKSSEYDYEEEEKDEDEENEENEAPETETGEHHQGIRLLTYIQIFGSIAVLAAALALRVFNADLYKTVRSWYSTAVNDSIIADEQMDQAKRTVIGLWNNLSSAGPQSAASSQPQGSQGTQSAQSAQSSQATASSQSAQSTQSQPAASGKSGNNQQVSP